jgi:hypothetical protein
MQKNSYTRVFLHEEMPSEFFKSRGIALLFNRRLHSKNLLQFSSFITAGHVQLTVAQFREIAKLRKISSKRLHLRFAHSTESSQGHFKAKSTRIPLCGLDQPVQCFRVRIAYAMIEIGNDRLIPVIHGGQQRLERLFQVGRDTRFPVLVGGFGLQTVAFLPDVENAFFQPVGGFQIREVLCPGFHDQPLGLVQIAVTMQENIAVVHQSTPGSVGGFRSQSLAHRFKTFIGHLHNVKVVDHHLGVWQDDLSGVKVGTPHVHANQGNLILMGQTIQITGCGGFVPVAQEVYDPAIADVADHATGFVEQVNFIDLNVIGNAGKSA